MTVAEMTRQLVTPDELLQIPDNGSMELVDGHIVEKSVSILSSRTEGLFLTRFQNFLFEHPLAEVYPATLGYQCFPDDPGKIRKPDMTLIRNERITDLEDQDSGYMPIIPDLAVEVISPNDLAYEITAKVNEYKAAGFPLVWVADPASKSIIVYPLGRRPLIYTVDDEISLDEVLPGFRCKVADFFSTVSPTK